MAWLTDLFEAIGQRDLATIKRLIHEDPARLSYSASYCPNLLWTASERSSVEVVRYFLEDMGLNPETRSEEFGNSLSIAASGGNVEVVQFLLSKNVTMDTSTSEANPLMAAVTSAAPSALDVVQCLLDAGIDSRIKYDLLGAKMPMGAYELAVEQGQVEAAEIIRENDARLGGS